MTYMGLDRRSGRERRTLMMTEAEAVLADDGQRERVMRDDTMAVSPGSAAARVDTHGDVRGVRTERGSLVLLVTPALLVGAGLAGIMDTAVFHHLLQWHHLLSEPFAAGSTELETSVADMQADGLLQAASAIAILLGLAILWSAAARRPHRLWAHAGASFVGWMMVGWALFNILVISIPAFLFDRHHVNVVGDGQLGWDIAFLGLSLVLGAIGLGVANQGRPRDVTHDDWVG